MYAFCTFPKSKSPVLEFKSTKEMIFSGVERKKPFEIVWNNIFQPKKVFLECFFCGKTGNISALGICFVIIVFSIYMHGVHKSKILQKQNENNPSFV